VNPHRNGTILRGIAICLSILGTFFLAHSKPDRSKALETAYSANNPVYLPLTTHLGLRPPIELVEAYTVDSAGNKIFAFHKGDPIQYAVQIANFKAEPKEVDLVWTQTGPEPCGEVLIYDARVAFDPGVGVYTHAGMVPGCFGVYTNTIQATHLGDTYTFTFQFAVPTPSQVVIGSKQGFDKCSLPTVQQMQTWWKESPYYTMNLYIGGNSLACDDPKLNPAWIYQVNQQGWTFILTWVGPQAPCTSFKKRMDPDPAVAYTQGRANADAAAEAAWRLGFFDDRVIYYDIEAYPLASPECRMAVASFLQGWVERLHELGLNAGAYGGACSSYMSDWAENPSPPDNVWIAHWYADEYDENASVYGAPCVPDALWANHQRLKQYTGGHQETWGGLTFTIDSDVIDGQVNDFQPGSTAQTALPASSSEIIAPSQGSSPVQAFGVIARGAGWILRGGQLWQTEDSGANWMNITPRAAETSEILSVQFLDAKNAWLALRSMQPGFPGSIAVLNTADGGESWQAVPFPLRSDEAASIAEAYPQFLDSEIGWVALKLQSGSNFSLGRLFSTRDGGLTWEERPLPLGEPVRFVDPLRGFTAGGPLGNQFFRTLDGGLTWETYSLPDLSVGDSDYISIGLPEFESEENGWLPVTLTGDLASRLAVLRTIDGGATWDLESLLNFESDLPPGESAPFTLSGNGAWWAAGPGAARLYISVPDGKTASDSDLGRAGSIVALDLAPGGYGWVLIQEGACTGIKHPDSGEGLAGTGSLSCELRSYLLATDDRGRTMREIPLP
jgi:photosystem II stability/assembly factor-like uncharacterized protein